MSRTTTPVVIYLSTTVSQISTIGINRNITQSDTNVIGVTDTVNGNSADLTLDLSVVGDELILTAEHGEQQAISKVNIVNSNKYIEVYELDTSDVNTIETNLLNLVSGGTIVTNNNISNYISVVRDVTITSVLKVTINNDIIGVIKEGTTGVKIMVHILKKGSVFNVVPSRASSGRVVIISTSDILPYVSDSNTIIPNKMIISYEFNGTTILSPQIAITEVSNVVSINELINHIFDETLTSFASIYAMP